MQIPTTGYLGNAYEVLAGALDRNQHAAVAYANEYFTELESDIIQFDQTVYSQWKLVELPAYSHKELLLNCLCGAQPCGGRCLHNSHGMFDSSFVAAGDYEFWLRVAEDFPFEHVSEPLGVVFENPHGIVKFRSSFDNGGVQAHSIEILRRQGRGISHQARGVPGKMIKPGSAGVSPALIKSLFLSC